MRLILSAILLIASGTANSAVVINVYESGSNVVFSTTGSLNLSGATFGFSNTFSAGLISGGDNWYIASGSGSHGWGNVSPLDHYILTSTDGEFGTNSIFVNPPSSNTGDDFSIFGNHGRVPYVGVKSGYISGSAINSEMIFSGTIATLNLNVGVYHYAIPNDFITLNIVPVPAAFWLFGSGLGFLGWVKRKAA